MFWHLFKGGNFFPFFFGFRSFIRNFVSMMQSPRGSINCTGLTRMRRVQEACHSLRERTLGMHIVIWTEDRRALRLRLNLHLRQVFEWVIVRALNIGIQIGAKLTIKQRVIGDLRSRLRLRCLKRKLSRSQKSSCRSDCCLLHGSCLLMGDDFRLRLGSGMRVWRLALTE